MNQPGRARAIALAVVGALGLVAWSIGATHRGFDYDEIYHAHATWLIADGLRPFHDFFGVHSPLAWYPLAALWWLVPDSAAAMLPLRMAASLGTLLSVSLVMTSIAAVRPELSRWWLLAGAAVVVFDPAILDYAVEFRPDGWATATLFLAFTLFLHGRPAPIVRRCATFSVIATLGVLASPKCALLLVLFIPIDLLSRLRQPQQVRRALLGYVIGTGAAGVVAVGALWAAGVDPILTFEMTFRYQWLFERQTGFAHGMLASVLGQPALLILVGAGMMAWAGHLFAGRRAPSAYEMALVSFLVAQLAITNRPYKQYYALWFLVGASFLPFIGVLLEPWRPRAAAWVFAGIVALAGWGAAAAAVTFSARDEVERLLAFYAALERMAPAGSSIVAFPPLHPVVRRDAFYGWSRTTDPGGLTTEAIMRALAVPDYAKRFDHDQYRRELETHPPALVVVPVVGDTAYEPRQWEVIRDYLDAHRDRYVLENLLRPVWIRRLGG